MKILVIGERCNTRGNMFTRPASDHEGRAAFEKRIYDDPWRYWEFSRRVQAFTDRQRERVASLIPGYTVDSITWINLCLPHPTPGYWTTNEAARAARCLAEAMITIPILDRHQLVCACSSRVSHALRSAFRFEYPQHYGEITRALVTGQWFTRLPHPSGLNRAWNNPEMAVATAERLHSNLGRISS